MSDLTMSMFLNKSGLEEAKRERQKHRAEPTMECWIDEVKDGWVYGRYAPDGLTGFAMRILDVPECQRVDLEPGSYCAFVNGFLLVHKIMWKVRHSGRGHEVKFRLG